MIFALLLLQLAAPPEDLKAKLTELDAQLFEAYNTCEVDKFDSFFAEDVEFYHDQGGLSTGKASLREAIKNNICGKVHRTLAPSTLTVYPMKNYGAVQTGIHFFCKPEAAKANGGKCPEGSGVARFMHLWNYKDGKWRITRVLSYDHCNNCSTSTAPEYRLPGKTDGR
jgi:hypothetical protein